MLTFHSKNVFMVLAIGLPIFFNLAILTQAAPPETNKQFNKLRVLKKSKIIRCSPTGENGTLKPKDAIAKLKKGMCLYFEPGDYRGMNNLHIIRTDNILVDGKPGAQYYLQLVLTGKSNVIRNLNLYTLEIRNKTQIIDIMVKHLDVSGAYKYKCQIYNSAFMHLYIHPAAKKGFEISFENCTVSFEEARKTSSPRAILYHGAISFIFRNCVIYSQGTVFPISATKKKQNYLLLENSYIFGKQSIAEVTFKLHQEREKINDLNGLKKYFKQVTVKKSKIQKPEFQKNVVDKKGQVPQNFQLKDDADSRGVHFTKKWLDNFKEFAHK
jgi:hypothetical protein